MRHGYDIRGYIKKLPLSSTIFTFFNANEDIIVKQPQKPIAIGKEYLESKFKEDDTTEKTPRTKIPIMLTNNTFETRFPNSSKGEYVLPYIPEMHPKLRLVQEKEIQFPSLSHAIRKQSICKISS